MATGTNDLLNRLRKLLAEAADTDQLRQPWQELFGRQDSVPPRAIRAAEAVKDFAGSWAASYTLGHGKLPTQADIPAPISGFDNRLGRRGYPEINFVPYAWNTNAQGDLGLSLVGHPVSFEVHGPTLKNAELAQHQWAVTGPRRLEFSTAISNIYGLKSDDVENHPYWIVVTDPGGPLYDPTTKKVSKPPTLPERGHVETEKHLGTARYELFRIKSIRDNTIIDLEGPKTLDEYFETTSTSNKRFFKAITILKAKTARLVPVRGSNNRSFVVTPPTSAASDDLWMPRVAWKGDTADYMGRVALPIPRPVAISLDPEYDSDHGTFKAILSHEAPLHVNFLGISPPGRFRIGVKKGVYEWLDKRLGGGDPKTTIIHISEVNLDKEGLPAVCPTAKRALGYFEAVKIGRTKSKGYFVELRHHNTVDPETGVPFFLANPNHELRTQGPGVGELHCTAHDGIDSLHGPGVNFDADALDSARLTGLIDPKEVGRSLKVHGTNDVPGGGSSARADRAIPNTQKYTDPGSLLDLGFRMVLFPSDKSKAERPDYERPLASRELILDPDLDETQYVDIDYASGVVKFSHTPKPGGDIALDKAGRPLLWAAFVPYSMEGGQRGSSVRMTGGDLHSANLGYPNPTQRDVFSSKKMLRHLPKVKDYSWGDTLTVLRGSFEVGSFPETGHLTLAMQPSGLPYLDTQDHHPLSDLHIYYDGIKWGPEEISFRQIYFQVGVGPFSTIGPNTITLNQDTGVFFRHRGDLDHRFDTTYGSSARTDVVRLAYGNVTYNFDGSMTVMPTAVAGPAEELRAFFPLGDLGDGKTSEISRFHFDAKTQRWSTDDPPWMPSGHLPAPDQTHEIGIEVSRGRMYTNWESSPASGVQWRRVAGLIEDIGVQPKVGSPVPNGFSIALRNTNTGDWNALELFESHEQDGIANLLSAVVEGATVSSVVITQNIPAKGQRFGYALKRDMVTIGSTDKRRAEAASNPLWWATATSDGVLTWKDISDHLNTGTPAGRYGLRTLTGANRNVVDFDSDPVHKQKVLTATGRQIQALPETPYLVSKLEFPVEIKTALRFLIDLRSADPRTPTAWIHYEMVIPKPVHPVTCTNPIELADYLNKTGLYSDVATSQNPSTLVALGKANFLQDILTPSENPELQNTTTVTTTAGPLTLDAVKYEHQLIFTARNDHRHPAEAGDQVALLCGGRGVALNIESELGGMNASNASELHRKAAPFHNVLLEVRPASSDGKERESLVHFLGGTFEHQSGKSRCGLFYGDNSYVSGPEEYPTSVNTGSWDHHSLTLRGNVQELGFERSGTRPLGRYAGSFPITSFRRSGKGYLFDVKFPTGGMSDWFNDQSLMGAVGLGLDVHVVGGVSKTQRPFTDPNATTVGEANFLGRTGGIAYDHPASGWAGRWSWPWDRPEILPEGRHGKDAGITNIYMTFGVEEFNENSFGRALFDPYPISHTSFLLETKPVDRSEWQLPETVWSDIAFGDIVSFGSVTKGNQAIECSIEGRVLAKHKTSPHLYVLAGPRNSTSLVRGAGVTAGFDPTAITSPDQVLPLSSFGSLWGTLTTSVSIVPSPLGGTHAAVAHLVHNRNMDVSVKDQGLSGGTSTTPSSVLVGAGRVSLFSSMGALEPTGLALHNVIHGYRPDSLAPQDFSQSSVYLEAGAFTTTLGGMAKASFKTTASVLSSDGGLDTQGYWTDRKRKNTAVASTHGISNEAPRVGGVGGIRISGDAHLWLRNVRPLRSRYATAFPRSGGEISGRFDVSAGHLPSKLTTLAPDGVVIQETTIQIALTGADLLALRGAAGGDWVADWLGDPVTGISAAGHAALSTGQLGYHVGQMGLASQPPILMPSLVGSYLRLSDEPITSNTKISPPSFGTNSEKWSTGLFRIVSAPVLTNTRPLSDAPNMHQPLGRPSGRDDALSPGRQRESQVVATLLIRIEGFKRKNLDDFKPAKLSSFAPVTPSPIGDDWQLAGDGLFWGVFRDRLGAHAIMTADVVDPGGSPTGAPMSLRGLTLDPQLVAGKSSLSAELIPLLASYQHPASHNTEGYAADSGNAPLFEQTGCELLGVHDQVGRFGQHFSRAFFAVNDAAFMGEDEEYNVQTVPFSARMVVLADSAGLLDGAASDNAKGEFVVDPETGRVNHLGYPRRLGPGVIMDGGLGLVQATAFRATPRSRQVESIGQMTVWGRGAWPFYNGLKPADVGVELPSTFNTAEFHGELSVANPQGRIVFESPWAAQGLAANMLAAEAASQVYSGPAVSGNMALDMLTVYTAASGSTAGISVIHGNYSGSREFKSRAIQKSLGLGISDTLFPHISSGLVFRTPGTAVYERAFRSLDATGMNPYRKSRVGSHNRSGIAGMGIPVQGEVLLLPQGPTGRGEFRANQNLMGDPTKHASGGGITPTDIPLYEFVNATISSIYVEDGVGGLPPSATLPNARLDISPFGFNASAVFQADSVFGAGQFSNPANTNAPCLSIFDRGHYTHFGQPGAISQAYRHAISREDPGFFNKDTALVQMRLLDGMVVEDTTNGTFYTVGATGRFQNLKNASTSLGILGDGVRSPTNGSLVAQSVRKVPYFNPIDPLTPFIRYAAPEVVYDISENFDPDVDREPFSEKGLANGFGDRVDRRFVRRPLSGHNMRITPNVEFVPVLGPRGVSGGLSEPAYWRFETGRTGDYWVKTALQGDAVFYDLNHRFVAPSPETGEGDVGRMLYVCGTHTYAHTGWYTIIDVVEDWQVVDRADLRDGRGLYVHPEHTAKVKSVALLRKYNCDDSQRVPLSMKPKGTRSDDHTGWFPLRPRAPYVSSISDRHTNCGDQMGHFGLCRRSTPVVHGDQEWLLPSYDNLYLNFHLAGEVNQPAPYGGAFDGFGQNPLLFSTSISKADMVLAGVCGDNTDWPTAAPVALTSELAANFLNGRSESNGVLFLETVFPGINAGNGFVVWNVKGDVLSAHYDLAALESIGLSESYPVYDRVVGGSACFQVHWRTRRDVAQVGVPTGALAPYLPYTSPESISYDVYDGPHVVGFSKDIGHSCGVDRSVGDRNNALPMPYIGYLSQDPAGIYNPNTTEDTDLVFPLMPVQSAARGLRWVFSHPLSEENAGSYVHLTRPHIHRFGSILDSQRIAGQTTEMQIDSTWTSGHQRALDVQKNKGRLDLRTDIFRINRCPTTTKLLLGGDCETFFPEFSNNRYLAATVKGDDTGFSRPIMYAPLGVHGSWPDTDEPSVLGETGGVHFPVRYALQPIAREKIITVSPSSAKSSTVMSRGRSELSTGSVQGPQGVGPGLAIGMPGTLTAPETSFAMEPWQLVSRTDMTRFDSMNVLEKIITQSKGYISPTGGYYDSRVEINNANFDMKPIANVLAEVAAEGAILAAEMIQLVGDIVAMIVGPMLTALMDLAAALLQLLTEFFNLIVADQLLKACLADPVSANYHILVAELEDLKGDKQEVLSWIDYLKTKKDALELYLKKADEDLVAATKLVFQITAELTATTADASTVTAQISAIDTILANLATLIAAEDTIIDNLETMIQAIEDDLQTNYDWNSDHEADHYANDMTVWTLLQDRKAHQQDLQKHVHVRNMMLADKMEKEQEKLELMEHLTLLNDQITLLNDQLADATTAQALAENDFNRLKNKFKHTDWSDHSNDMYALGDWDFVFPAMLGQFESPALDDYCYSSMLDVANRWATDISNDLANKAAQVAAEAAAVIHGGNTLEFLLNAFESTTISADQAIEIAYAKLLVLENIIYELVWLVVAFIEKLMDILKLVLEVFMEGLLGLGGWSAPNPEWLTPIDSTYMWSPAGEWWQLYQPAWASNGPGADHPPPTLKVDLTEAFTQAIAPGSGLNSPHPGRAPRGVRLNRLWVNFGVWGNDPAATSGLGGDRRPWETPGYLPSLETNTAMGADVLDPQYMAFNLILEIPGSQARVWDANDGSDFAKSSGNSGFPFGGRAPTASTTHNSNSLTRHDPHQQRFPGGTIVVPLYCNREAGDMMPNTMERFVTVGPKPSIVARKSYEFNAPVRNPTPDWSGGFYEYGFGTASERPDDLSYFDPNTLAGSGSMGLSGHLHSWDIPDLWLAIPAHMQDANKGLFVNSYNPVLWGGMDFARWKDDATELDGVFSHAKYSRVQASVFPRQSRTGGGLRSAFTSGLIPHGKAFSGFYPQSLSAATLTGLTVAHSGTMPPPPTAEAGSYAESNLEAGYSCPHGFTIALTPVGDFYHEPMGEVGSGLLARLPIHPRKATEQPGNPKLDYNDPRLRVGRYGRQLETLEAVPIESSEMLRQMRVGNWLELILERYGIPAASGSMLPPGARVYLEVAVGPGNASNNNSLGGNLQGTLGAGAWVGNIKLSFDVETADGTAWTTDVNVLGDEEG